MKTKVDMKEKELEEKLIVRKQVEIEKLLDDQKAVLDSRRQEFELELKQMRISLDEELEKKKGAIEQMQVEIGHKGEKLEKREAALANMEERVKKKEMDLETRMKAVKDKEKALETKEQKMHMENEQFLKDKESLHKLKNEIEKIAAETTKQESRIREEHESLRITKEERLQFLRLQCELMQQIGRVKQEEELPLQGREELKQDRGRSEKKWEALALDERKARTFEKRSKEELDNINYARKLAEREMEEVQYEKLALKREREKISVHKRMLEKKYDKIFKGTDDVEAVSICLKEHQEELYNERTRFGAFMQNTKVCNSCEELFWKFLRSNRQPEAIYSRRTSLIWKIDSGKLPESTQPDDDTLDTIAGDDYESSAEQSFTYRRIQEGAELSLESEIKSDKPRGVRGRSKTARGRSQATNAASRDLKSSDGEILKTRQHEQSYRSTEVEHAAGDSDAGVDSITTSGCRKKRQTAVPVCQTHGQSRYHLRRHRNVGTEEDKAQTSTGADREINKLALHEKTKNTTGQLVEDLEKQRRNLDMEFQRKEVEGEKDYNERARTYEKRSPEKLGNNNYVKKLAHREMEEVQHEKLALEREREEIFVQKKKLIKKYAEARTHTNILKEVRIYWKERQEELYNEKRPFVAFLEDLKRCNSCGKLFAEFVQANPLPDAENSRRASSLGKLASANLPESSQPDDDTLDTVPGNYHESSSEQSLTCRRIQEGAEVSLQLDIKSYEPRGGRGRSKSVIGRSQATNAASRDLKSSDWEFPRKRKCEQAYRITEVEHTTCDSDAGSESITTGGRRMKRQTTVRVSQTPGQSRYHLRRQRKVGTEEDKAQSSTGAMGKQENVNANIRTVPSPKDNLIPPQGEYRENGISEMLVETVTHEEIVKGEYRENGISEMLVETVTHEEIVKVEAETAFKDNNTGKRLVEDPQLEARGRRENGEGDEEKRRMLKEEKKTKQSYQVKLL